MMIFLFLVGAAIYRYPYINGAVVGSSLNQEAQRFIDRVTEPREICEMLPNSSKPDQLYANLRKAMVAYNHLLAGLGDALGGAIKNIGIDVVNSVWTALV